jgi:hypothetical protein
MSFLSSHRLHWGSHDALTGHLFTDLELKMHDLPLARSPEDAAETHTTADGAPDFAAKLKLAANNALPDVPGP